MRAEAICEGDGMVLDYGGPFDCPGCPACLAGELSVPLDPFEARFVRSWVGFGEVVLPGLETITSAPWLECWAHRDPG